MTLKLEKEKETLYNKITATRNKLTNNIVLAFFLLVLSQIARNKNYDNYDLDILIGVTYTAISSSVFFTATNNNNTTTTTTTTTQSRCPTNIQQQKSCIQKCTSECQTYYGDYYNKYSLYNQ
jgi:hypothetical protein